jgi:DNA-binding transcriptional ArsR family regulator
MSNEEDTYNIIFKAMQHPIRRRILRTLSEAPSTYTEIQKTLNIDNGLLNYHLDNMRDLLTKNEEEGYTLSEFGKATVNLVRGVEEPIKSVSLTGVISSQLTIKILAITFAVVVLTYSAVLFDVNNKYTDLSTRLNSQSIELARLQYANSRLEAKLSEVNATLISTQKSYLLKAALDSLTTREGSRIKRVNNGTLLILDTDTIDSLEVPEYASSIPVKLVSQDEVKSLTMNTNVTTIYSLDRISLIDSTHGIVKFSRRDAFSENGIPSSYGVHEFTFFLMKRDVRWNVYLSEEGIGDYFRAVPLFDN